MIDTVPLRALPQWYENYAILHNLFSKGQMIQIQNIANRPTE